MVSKITFIKSGKRRQIGMTLIELMVAVGILSVVLAGFAALIFYTGRSFAALANYVDLDATSRHALDTMSREIRQTKRLKAGTTTSLTFEDFDGKDLVYEYDAVTRQLFRTKDGVVDDEPLLTECNFLEFNLFQRNPIAGKYDQYPTANPATCKLVQLRWVCSRDLIKQKWNTESVQSAKIVIRKQ
ncbi:MAG TPA: prepilin-type N-terminal cleavage/methylation domain-containing protein [Verrucomicrobiae bacterium]